MKRDSPIREPWPLPAITDADMAAAIAEGERYRARLAELFERTDSVNDQARALSFQVVRATKAAEMRTLLTEIQRLNYVQHDSIDFTGIFGACRICPPRSVTRKFAVFI